VHRRLIVRRAAPGLDRPFGHERFTRVEGGEHGKQVFRMRIGSDLEFAGGEIKPGGAQDAPSSVRAHK